MKEFKLKPPIATTKRCFIIDTLLMSSVWKVHNFLSHKKHQSARSTSLLAMPDWRFGFAEKRLSASSSSLL